MAIKIIKPTGLAEPRGYSNGVLAEGGNTLFVAGQIGWDHDRRIVSDDLVGQFAEALDNVLTVVRAAGGDAGNITRMLIFVTDKREYLSRRKEIGVTYRRVMGDHYPAMSLVEVSALLEDLAKVEIEATAVI
jgi:enamine deaminase RidA (YjgF/YER057c/UK114 family)